MTSLFVGIFALLPLGACSLLPIQDVGSNFIPVIYIRLSIRFSTPDSNTFFPCLDYQWRIQNFPDGGGGLFNPETGQKPFIWQDFCRTLHEN